MNLTLTPDIQSYIDSQLACGAYRDRDELVIEAIRALRAREERTDRRAALIADLEQGVQSLDQGLGRETNAESLFNKTIR